MSYTQSMPLYYQFVISSPIAGQSTTGIYFAIQKTYPAIYGSWESGSFAFPVLQGSFTLYLNCTGTMCLRIFALYCILVKCHLSQ